MTTEQPLVLRLFRGAVSTYVTVVTLMIYAYTRDAAGEIKWLVLYGFGAALGAGWLLALGWFRLPVRRPRFLLEILLLFTGWMILSSLCSDYLWFSLVESGRFLFLFVLYWMAAQLYETPEQAKALLKSICVAVGVAAMYAAAQAAGYDPFPWQDRTAEVYRLLPGPFGNPNYAAHVLVLAIIIASYLLLSGWLWALPLITGYGSWLWYTEQRGGLVALAAAAGLLITAWVVRRVVRRPAWAAITTLVLAALLAIGAGAGVMILHKVRTGSAFPLDASILLRYQALVSSADMVMDRPLLGVGPRVYRMENARHWTPYEQEYFAREMQMNYHVHNEPLEVAADGGLPAAGLYLALFVVGIGVALVMAFSAGERDRRRLGWMLAALFAAFFVDSLFGFNLHLPVSASVLFLCFGLLESQGAPGAGPISNGGDIGLWTWMRWPALAVLGFFAVVGASAFSGQYFLHQGMGAMAAENRPLAGYYWRLGESFAPWLWEFPWRQGQIAMADGDMAKAVVCFERSLALNPSQIMVRIPLAEARLRLAQDIKADTPEGLKQALILYQEAAKDAQLALDTAPGLASAQDLLGRTASLTAGLLAAQKDPGMAAKAGQYWEIARKQLERAVISDERNGNRAAIYRNLGRVCLALKDIDRAETAFSRAAQTDFSDADTWPLFLEFARKHHRFDRLRAALFEQIDWLRRQKTVDHNALATAQLFLANVLETGYHDLAGAESAYRSAVQHAPQRPEVWANFARYAFANGRTILFKETLSRSCRLMEKRAPDTPPLPQVAAIDAVNQRGAAALEQATLVLAAAARSFPPGASMPADQALGWASVMLFEALQQTPPAQGGACSAAFNLGIVFSAISEFERAEQLFGAAKTCLPADMEVALATQLADMRVRQNRAPEALLLLEEARAAHPGDTDLAWAAARTLVKLSRFTEARDAYAALALSPQLDIKSRALLDEEMNALNKRLAPETNPV